MEFGGGCRGRRSVGALSQLSNQAVFLLIDTNAVRKLLSPNHSIHVGSGIDPLKFVEASLSHLFIKQKAVETQ